jgi:hypothetical protein
LKPKSTPGSDEEPIETQIDNCSDYDEFFRAGGLRAATRVGRPKIAGWLNGV